MGRRWRGAAWCACGLSVGAAACIPYTVGTTAQPLGKGERAPTLIWYSIPNGVALMRDSAAFAFTGIDVEGRLGVSDRADAGVRITAGTGLVATYKYRLTNGPDRRRAAVAVMGGLGLVNLGNHAHFELTVLGSAPQALLTPYGGLRAAQVAPLSVSAVSDSPTAGGFAGLRIGDPHLGIGVELGVYYDRSALGLRSDNVLVVPALVVHGRDLIDLLRARR